MLQSEINVTPLVDVCLVLLIIFMVVMPTVANGPVELPEASQTNALEERALPLTVKHDGSVYIDTLVIRRDELASELQRLRSTEASRPIQVRADKRTSYGEVASVLGACRDAGWQDVTLVSARPSAS